MSKKSANTDREILKVIKDRWSPRAFSDKKVSDDDLLAMFEAARWAPSSYNGQPWRFIIARREDSENYKRMKECMVDFNQGWIEPAPVIGITLGRKHFENNDKPNKHHLHDVGLAMGQFILEGMSRDIYVHQMAGYEEEKAREKLEIPEEYEPCAMFALGYIGDPSQLDEDLRKKELAAGERKPLDELLFKGKFGQKYQK